MWISNLIGHPVFLFAKFVKLRGEGEQATFQIKFSPPCFSQGLIGEEGPLLVIRERALIGLRPHIGGQMAWHLCRLPPLHLVWAEVRMDQWSGRSSVERRGEQGQTGTCLPPSPNLMPQRSVGEPGALALRATQAPCPAFSHSGRSGGSCRVCPRPPYT